MLEIPLDSLLFDMRPRRLKFILYGIEQLFLKPLGQIRGVPIDFVGNYQQTGAEDGADQQEIAEEERSEKIADEEHGKLLTVSETVMVV